MIITNATIALATRHQYEEKHEVSERLDFWLAEPSGTVADDPVVPRWRDQVSISPHGFSLNLLASQVNRQQFDLDTALDSRSRVNLLILQMMFEQVTGRALRISTPGDHAPDGGSSALSLEVVPPSTNSPSAGGSGLVYERHERYQETEKLGFQAMGVIQTADGREISFSTSLTMSRAYYEESSLIIREGDAARIDPLVINFDGAGTELSATRFAFDLDSDGTDDQIAILRPGSGFLALDRNGDGVINNGSELFGPSSGRGFAELARYDEDGNYFIDEADSIYSQLRIWMVNEDGTSQLMGNYILKSLIGCAIKRSQ
jgi:hypothetical protein